MWLHHCDIQGAISLDDNAVCDYCVHPYPAEGTNLQELHEDPLCSHPEITFDHNTFAFYCEVCGEILDDDLQTDHSIIHNNEENNYYDD